MEYTSVIERKRTLSGLDKLGLELANRNHEWTSRERAAFDRRVRELQGKRKK